MSYYSYISDKIMKWIYKSCGHVFDLKVTDKYITEFVNVYGDCTEGTFY